MLGFYPTKIPVFSRQLNKRSGTFLGEEVTKGKDEGIGDRFGKEGV